MNRAALCPAPEALKALLTGDLSTAQEQHLVDHLDRCVKCQQAFEQLGPNPRDVIPVSSVDEVSDELPGDPALRQAIDKIMNGERVQEANRLDTVSLDFLSPSDSPDFIGRLGPYHVYELVSRGGMGIVLRAHDSKLSRVVAIKVLAPELGINSTARQRFLREAQAAAAISHDHVVTIYAVAESDGMPYLVMEYVNGESLQEKIDRDGMFEIKEILRIGMQTASGLAAAHSQGLVHRDIKPANILLENGIQRVKISDFGLARAVDDVRITRSGVVAGTPQFMSPQQARGETVDYRSDLFSLGGVLYAMCTGRPPFRAESTVAMIHRVCEDQPRPIQQINSNVPDWLVEIIGCLLEKDPGSRIQSASEIADILGRYLAHLQQPSVMPMPPRLKSHTAVGSWRQRLHTGPRGWLVAAATLVLAMATLGFTEVNGITEFTRTMVHIVRGDGTLVVEVDDPNVRLVIDGEELVFTGTGPNEIRLRPGPHQLRATKNGRPLRTESLRITRGGRQVVKVTREPTGEPLMSVRRLWADSDVELSGKASPDGRFVSFVNWKTGNLAVRDLTTGMNRDLTNEGTWEEPNRWAGDSIWSMDSQQIAYGWRNEGDPKRWELRITGINDTDPRVVYVAEPATQLAPRAWSPDGNLIAVWIKKRNAATRIGLISVSSGELRVLDALSGRQAGGLSFSRDGRHLLLHARPTADAQQRDILLFEIDQQRETALVSHPADDHSALFSPDGKWIMFLSDRRGSTDMWASRVEDGRAVGSAELVKSNVGPDISTLGFTGDASYYFGITAYNWDVYSIAYDSDTGKVLDTPTKAVKILEGSNLAADFSPDGKHLAYVRRPSSSDPGADSWTLVIRTIETGQERQFSRPLERIGFHWLLQPRWRPDGQAIALTSWKPENRLACFGINTQSGELTTLVPRGAGPRPTWSVDGKRLFFCRDPGYEQIILSRDVDTSQETELYREHVQGRVYLDLSPDGKWLAFTNGETVLRVMPATGGEPRELWRIPAAQARLLRGGLVWTRDGKHLVFGATSPESSDVNQLMQIDVDGGPPRALGVQMPGLSHLRMHPNGKQIMFTAQTGRDEVWVLEIPLFQQSGRNGTKKTIGR